MVPLNNLKKDLHHILLSVAVTVVVVITASTVPLERILSEYPGSPYMPWHTPWRIAIATFYLWLATAIVYSFDKKPLTYLLLFSGLTFAVAHYVVLLSLPRTCEVRLLPLVYQLECGKKPALTYLDLGQIVIVATFVAFIHSIRGKTYLRKASSSSRR